MATYVRDGVMKLAKGSLNLGGIHCSDVNSTGNKIGFNTPIIVVDDSTKGKVDVRLGFVMQDEWKVTGRVGGDVCVFPIMFMALPFFFAYSPEGEALTEEAALEELKKMAKSNAYLNFSEINQLYFTPLGSICLYLTPFITDAVDFSAHPGGSFLRQGLNGIVGDYYLAKELFGIKKFGGAFLPQNPNTLLVKRFDNKYRKDGFVNGWHMLYVESCDVSFYCIKEEEYFNLIDILDNRCILLNKLPEPKTDWDFVI